LTGRHQLRAPLTVGGRRMCRIDVEAGGAGACVGVGGGMVWVVVFLVFAELLIIKVYHALGHFQLWGVIIRTTQWLCLRALERWVIKAPPITAALVEAAATEAFCRVRTCAEFPVLEEAFTFGRVLERVVYLANLPITHLWIPRTQLHILLTNPPSLHRILIRQILMHYRHPRNILRATTRRHLIRVVGDGVRAYV